MAENNIKITANNFFPQGWKNIIYFGETLLNTKYKKITENNPIIIRNIEEQHAELVVKYQTVYPINIDFYDWFFKKLNIISSHVCQICGKPGYKHVIGFWHSILCEECSQNIYANHIFNGYLNAVKAIDILNANVTYITQIDPIIFDIYSFNPETIYHSTLSDSEKYIKPNIENIVEKLLRDNYSDKIINPLFYIQEKEIILYLLSRIKYPNDHTINSHLNYFNECPIIRNSIESAYINYGILTQKNTINKNKKI